MSFADFMSSEVKIDVTSPSNYHNRVLIIGGKRFYVGAGVLATWSEHFRGMFSGNFVESNKTEIEIEEVDPDLFEIFLHILYKQNKAKISFDFLIPLIDMCYRFLAPSVLQIIKDKIKVKICYLDDQLLDLLRKACFYDIQDLKIMIVDRFQYQSIISKYSIADVASCADEFGLDDLKFWITFHLSQKLTLKTGSEQLDICKLFAIEKDKTSTNNYMNNRYTEVHSEKLVDDFRKLGLAGITDEEISKTENWIPKQIKMNNIIDLVHVALAHESEILKEKLHTRIHSFNYGLDPMTGIAQNTFIEVSFVEMNSCSAEVQTFIKISSSVSPLTEFVPDNESDE